MTSDIDQRRRMIMQRIQDAQDRVARFACLVYREATRGSPELIGSAVLVSIGCLNLLCTAAHVLEMRGSTNLYLPSGDTLQPFAGEFIITGLPASRNRADDKFDFAFVLLDDTGACRFSKFRFITQTDVDQNDVPRKARLYTFVGYPETRNKSHHDCGAVEPKLVSFTAAPLGQQEYDRRGFDSRIHLLVDFQRKKAFTREGRLQAPVDPHGLSGGPVWRLGDVEEFDRGTNAEKLVGIGMECRSNALIAVRMSLILEVIRRTFPDTASIIQPPTYVGAAISLAQK